jgi:hypothetical protein
MSHDQPQPQPQDFLLARASEMSLSSLLEAKSPSISGMFLKSVSGMIVAILAIILKGEFEFFFIHRQLLQDHEDPVKLSLASQVSCPWKHFLEFKWKNDQES